MADSQVEEQQLQEQASDEQSSGLFSSGFSKIGSALPSFSMPWGGNKAEATSQEQSGDLGAEAQPDGESAPAEGGDEAKGGFLSGVSGGFSKLTGGLPSVNVPSFGLPSMPWSKKDEEQAAETQEAAPDAPQTNENGEKSEFLAGMSGGFSKLTGGLPSVSVPSFGLPSMPWSKKEDEQKPASEDGAAEPEPAAEAQPDGSTGIADGSLNAMKAGADKFSNAVSGIFGVFRKSESDSTEKAAEEDTTPK